MSRCSQTGNAALLLALVTSMHVSGALAQQLSVQGVGLRVTFRQTNPTASLTLTAPDSTGNSSSAVLDTPGIAFDDLHIRTEPTPLPPSPTTSSSSVAPLQPDSPSEPGPGARQQMTRLADFAERNNLGASLGRCFNAVWGYLTKSRYGKLDDWNDAADMSSTYAKNFAEYMNRGNNAARWGLRRLPIDNPYDAPRGAVVVVAAGSPGTSNPVAGDIAVAAGNGRFINDGPYMTYGSRAGFLSGGGRLLGAYVPGD